MSNDTIRRFKDRLAYGLGLACLAVAMVPLASILIEVVRNGIAVINFGFLTSISTPSLGNQPAGGIGPAIQGTLIILGLACVIGIPPGIFAGIYLAEFGNNSFGRTVRFLNDVFTQFPSIVIGILISVLIVIPTRSFSPVAGAIALSLIMLPIVTRTTEESLKLVPNSIRDAASALGIRRWRSTLSIVLNTGKTGVATGVVLAIARVSGETAPLILTVLGSNFFYSGCAPSQSCPIDALPLRIFDDAFKLGGPAAVQQAWGAALVLIAIVLVLNITIRLATRGRYSTITGKRA
jgi:phosphate transport system permease protein